MTTRLFTQIVADIFRTHAASNFDRGCTNNGVINHDRHVFDYH